MSTYLRRYGRTQVPAIAARAAIAHGTHTKRWVLGTERIKIPRALSPEICPIGLFYFTELLMAAVLLLDGPGAPAKI